MRLVLDEHLDKAIAVELRRRGYDVVAVTEDPALEGMKDQELYDWATQGRRVVATYDASGFRPLIDARSIGGEPAAGVILISPKRHPQGPQSYGAVIRDLARILDENPDPDALRGLLRWLGTE
jgi:predicted nuclease of predicted toxin-antitoxin system